MEAADTSACMTPSAHARFSAILFLHNGYQDEARRSLSGVPAGTRRVGSADQCMASARTTCTLLQRPHPEMPRACCPGMCYEYGR